jgi:hypothetical protein
MKVEVSNGELLDKFSILKIKLQRIKDEFKLINIKNEIDAISKNCEEIIKSDLRLSEIFDELIFVNESLWIIEDEIRMKEKDKQFDSEFIELARSVYLTNDIRFNLKNKINMITSSKLVEEKSYESY